MGSGERKKEDEEDTSHFDEILERIGGTGTYQLLWFVVITMGMLAGAFILYSLNYFELAPDTFCYTNG